MCAEKTSQPTRKRVDHDKKVVPLARKTPKAAPKKDARNRTLERQSLIGPTQPKDVNSTAQEDDAPRPKRKRRIREAAALSSETATPDVEQGTPRPKRKRRDRTVAQTPDTATPRGDNDPPRPNRKRRERAAALAQREAAKEGETRPPRAKRRDQKGAVVPQKAAPATPELYPVPARREANVIALSREVSATTAVEIGRRPKQKRRFRLLWSFILLVVCPIIAGVIYYTEYATDRYVATAGFAIRGVDSGGSLDGIGALTGLPSAGSTTSDSYIVLKYLKSRDLLERLLGDIDLRTAFSADHIDPLSRLAPDASVEQFVRYWDRMTATSFDATSGIVTLEVQAFTPEDAKRIGDLVVAYTDDMVNQLSERAREDSVRFAQAEVARAEERLLAALQEIRAFRANEQSIDPSATAQIDIELLGTLESRLVDLRARIASISGQLDENAPSLIALQRQAAAIEEQINERTNVIGTAPPDSESTSAMSDLLVVYETLEVERTFAQETYQSALSSLEQARVDAGRQQRYLAIFSRPSIPQDARYPDRLLNILLLVVIVTCLWGIATLFVLSVRDHLS